MDQQHQPYYFSKRFLCWDEENRLVSFADCENAGFYQYDANGERTYKLAGGIAMQNIQGHWRSYNLLDNPTLYTSPYLVSTPKGYTKHYYAESERVASRIGGGGLGDITRTIMNMEDLLTDFWVGEDGLRWEEVWGSEFYETKLEGSRNHLTGVMMCAGADPLVEDNRLVELRTYWQYIQDEGEQECYWYHPDHLGSASWITDSAGRPVQHLQYLPWGESFVDQRSSTFDGARFTFSAKEKDKETGFSYFGSRYYSSDLSIWLSVDPMASKYPSLSPYVYCANNPIKLVDPNGEEIRIYYGNGKKYIKYTPGMKARKRYDAFVKDAINGLNFLYNHPQGDNNRVDYVASKTGEIIGLYQGTPGESSIYRPEKRELYWDNQSIDVFEEGSQSPIISLAHELDHADRSTKAWDAYYECKEYNVKTGDSPCDKFIEQARGADVDAAEASALEYENYVGGLLYNGKRISSYIRQHHSEAPIRQVKAATIFSYEE